MPCAGRWRRASSTSSASSWASWTTPPNVSKTCCSASTRTSPTARRRTCAAPDTASLTRSSPWLWWSKVFVDNAAPAPSLWVTRRYEDYGHPLLGNRFMSVLFLQMVHYVSTSTLVYQVRANNNRTMSESFGQLLRKADSMGDVRTCPVRPRFLITRLVVHCFRWFVSERLWSCHPNR